MTTTKPEIDKATPRPQLVQNARESILARIAKYNDPYNEEWDWDDIHDKWERHALSAVRDLVTVETERDTLLATNKRLRDVCESLLVSVKELYDQQQRISSPDTRWELPVYQQAREAMKKGGAALKESE